MALGSTALKLPVSGVRGVNALLLMLQPQRFWIWNTTPVS